MYIGAKVLKRLLPLIAPYLVVKAGQAELVQMVLDTVDIKNKIWKLSPEIREFRKEIAESIKELNHGIIYTTKQPA